MMLMLEPRLTWDSLCQYHTDNASSSPLQSSCCYIEPENAFLTQQIEHVDRATVGPIHIFIILVPWRPKPGKLQLGHVENIEFYLT